MKKDCNNCNIVTRNNNIMREQALRIAELKKEVNNLSISLEQYKKRERDITETLSFAKNKAEEIIQEAKIKNALECQRLRVYRNKWMRYIKDKNRAGRLAEDIEKTNEVLRDCQIQLEDMLYTDLGIEQSVSDSYIYERERLDDEPSLDYGAIIDNTRQNPAINCEKENDDEDKISNEELEKMLAKLKL